MPRLSYYRSTFVLVFMMSALGLSAQFTPPPQVTQPAQVAQQPAQVAPAAQASAFVGRTPDCKIFSLDLGMVGGYGVKANSPVVGRYFGINFTVADNFVLGFANISATHSYNLARLGYSLSPVLGLNIYVGNYDIIPLVTTTPVAGIGGSFTILKSKPEAGFSTTLKLRIEYLLDTTAAITSGDLLVAVSTGIGL